MGHGSGDDGTVPGPPEPLTIDAPALHEGEVGVPYQDSLEIRGGTPPYAVLVLKGVLPWGLRLDSAGNITGFPIQARSKSFTVQVTDQEGSSVSQSFTITILKALRIATRSLPRGRVGRNYFVIPKATGGKTPYTWSFSGSLPEGLSLNGSTGRITGIPTTSGSFTPTFQVTDPMGGVAAKSLRITIF